MWGCWGDTWGGGGEASGRWAQWGQRLNVDSAALEETSELPLWALREKGWGRRAGKERGLI